MRQFELRYLYDDVQKWVLKEVVSEVEDIVCLVFGHDITKVKAIRESSKYLRGIAEWSGYPVRFHICNVGTQRYGTGPGSVRIYKPRKRRKVKVVDP